MNLILKYLTAGIIFLVFACESSGGVWLGDGSNSGNPYTFGPNQDVETLKNIAKAYSEKNVEKLSSYYSEEYMNKKRKENYSKWLNSMEIITADGGFDFSIDFNQQELMASRLILTEIFYALAMQKQDGILVDQ